MCQTLLLQSKKGHKIHTKIDKLTYFMIKTGSGEQNASAKRLIKTVGPIKINDKISFGETP